MGARTLRGRRGECEALERLLEAARAGNGSIVVLRGEAGSGKTALLDFLLERASDFRIARVLGVDMELAFAGLHPALRADARPRRAPDPHRNATRCGWHSGWPMAMLRTGFCSVSPS
jgi:AAA ATPase domain